jgi:Right handed beta helix region
MMPLPPRKAIVRQRRVLGITAAACLALILVLTAIRVWPRSTSSGGSAAYRTPVPGAARTPVPTGTKVCGQPILDSPYTYDGPAGAYKSGKAGLPTYGRPRSDFPQDTAGVVVPTGTNDYLSYQLEPDVVYYLLPGTHTGGFQADTNDAFVGGHSGGAATVLAGNYSSGGQAIDSNSSIGNQSGVTIEYLTIEKYKPDADAAAINQEANTGWKIQYNTITLNVPGAGLMAGAGNVLKDNCLTRNGQYGFQSSDVDGFGRDSLTGGPYDVTVEGNEISYNDTCDFSGLLNNPAIGWKNHDPVPAQYRNPECGTVVGDGDQGGFKLWQTNGVTIEDNYIHDNWGPGGWADTDNANTTWTWNTITDNEGEAIIEEISYNFSITNNRIADNGWMDGLNNNSFPQAAIFISGSGSDTTFGGVPACRGPSCAGQKSYTAESVISDNVLSDNGGSIFLWQDSNRYCSDGSDGACTLVDSGPSGPFTVAACKANLGTAAVDTTTYTAKMTGSPAENWWDGCLWRTENVSVTRNTIDFNPDDIPDCNPTAWPACGAGGIFSEYGSPPNKEPGWVVPTQLTFFQNNTWSHNVYNGPSTFFAWNQGNGDNPVSWANWTGRATHGDKCGSAGERRSGYCVGPFGQDAHSTYHGAPH